MCLCVRECVCVSVCVYVLCEHRRIERERGSIILEREYVQEERASLEREREREREHRRVKRSSAEYTNKTEKGQGEGAR